MSLAKKFLEASDCHTIKIGSLDTEKPYPITHAQSVGTRFGPTVLLSIRESEFALKKVFLPRRYSDVTTDGDIEHFNKAKLHLIYSGVCEQTNGFLLSINGEEAGSHNRFSPDCHTIKIGSQDTEKPYTITHAQRVGTRFGPTVLVFIRESEFVLKVFLPRRYSDVITDEDIERFNKAKLYLIYSGVCEQTNGFILSNTGEEAGSHNGFSSL
jgi:hypothetical protein